MDTRQLPIVGANDASLMSQCMIPQTVMMAPTTVAVTPTVPPGSFPAMGEIPIIGFPYQHHPPAYYYLPPEAAAGGNVLYFPPAIYPPPQPPQPPPPPQPYFLPELSMVTSQQTATRNILTQRANELRHCLKDGLTVEDLKNLPVPNEFQYDYTAEMQLVGGSEEYPEYSCSYPGVSWNTRMRAWLVFYDDFGPRKSKTFNPKRYNEKVLQEMQHPKLEFLKALDPVAVAMHCACAYAAEARYRSRLLKLVGYKGDKLLRSSRMEKDDKKKVRKRTRSVIRKATRRRTSPPPPAPPAAAVSESSGNVIDEAPGNPIPAIEPQESSGSSDSNLSTSIWHTWKYLFSEIDRP